MAQKYIVQIVDDIDGTILDEDNSQTLTFAVEGQNYALDVSLAHAEEFRRDIEKYTAVARLNGQGRAVSNSGSKTKRSVSEDLAAVREWANKNGYSVSARGRIPANVQKAYDAATK